MNSVIVIPARFGSTRLPGKPLIDINGKPMIRRVYERCVKSRLADDVIVATDDKRILECVKGFGGKAVMTSRKHKSGTDRISEAVRDIDCDIIVNVQGDEPFIYPFNIDRLISAMKTDESISAATLAVKFRDATEVSDPNKVKVVTALNGNAIYFSRAKIPGGSGGKSGYLKHLGIYAFRKSFLNEFTKLKPGPLEKAERLEQLRILEYGYYIRVVLTERDSVSVDTPEDAERLMK